MVLRATIDMFVGMKMTAMAAELSSQLQESSFNELGFEDRLGLLVTAEWNRRQTNTVKRLIHNARFAALFAAVEEIAYYEDRKLGKAQMPRFSTCKFVDEGHHIILKGASGNGKTPTSPAPWATPPAAGSRRSATSVCRNFWTS